MKCSFKPYEGDKKYIFVSYAHVDGDRVAPILEKLNEAGFRLWYDEGIEWGTEWSEEIAKHISNCCVCIPFHSNASSASQNCRNEINYALKLRKTILSVYLEEVELSVGMDMQLSSYQSTYPYQYDDMSEFYERLMRTEVIRECRGNVDMTDSLPNVISKKVNEEKKYGKTTVLKLLGDCGDKAVCLYDEITQILYIKGKGDMWDFGDSLDNHAWCSEELFVKSAIISDGITSIGGYIFYKCSSLKSIVIPDSVTSIGEGAFYECSSLKSIVIPDSVTSIGEGAFEECSSLESIVIPDSVTSIGESAFWRCSSLKSIVIPDSVTSIGECAFYECSSLDGIIIPDSVTSIGESAFQGCSSLKNIVIPDSVTSIGESAFEKCSSLESIIIPDSVTTIGDWAFGSCSSLKKITIPAGINFISDVAFDDCPSLKEIHFLGTESQWNALGLESEDINNATVTFAK